ncbi:hypothetical protein [Mycobacteroides abscessus]|uniref:hypothetical protein n=1 Tax=Mycobacteroides abscessus TaxID=36809 RepID=UPI000929DCB6|nr:hypothetical protein [Mycobacteroides abscessus]SHQ53459.1 Uncharacterised protein [Mycobacteroides abscessus subsp. abscessus]
MSDEPSDAQKLIAEVMVTHALVYDDWAVVDADFYTCACGWHLSTSASVHDHAAYVAAEVDKALGGLTVEWAPCRDHCGIGTIYEQSMIHPTRAAAEKRCRQAYTNPGAWDIRRRFISSGWTVTE